MLYDASPRFRQTDEKSFDDGAEKRKRHCSKGAIVFRDPAETEWRGALQLGRAGLEMLRV